MTPAPIERSIILVRLDGIQGEVQEMQTLAKQSKHDFTKGPGHKLAAYHLHRTSANATSFQPPFITLHLNDVDTFCQAIKTVLAHPEQWDLHIE